MEASPDTVIEVREELMVSPSSGGNPIRRTAYFIKPCVSSIKESARDFLLPHSMFSGTATSNPDSKLPPKVRYCGWRSPQEEWKTWVQQMQPKYEYLWIKAGIDKAIKASTYEIPRKDELILELVQRWCSKTNTFIFPWGEATITLEDMKVLGGYSVMGAPVSSPLETNQQKETEAELVAARRIFNSTKARKVPHKPWMMHFMKNESKVEHEAFLVLWLSRFVFPATRDAILKSVFPIAIHLARGSEIALAPAVLASIYRDLSLLKSNINSATRKCIGSLSLWSPFQLVQIWALERFLALQPHPHAIEQGQPRMARWHLIKMLKNNNLKLTLDSAGVRNGFLWRPYKNSSMDNESFGRCLRVSELEGKGFVELYLPHRVAMQFGMDQDIPGMVARSNKDPWISYSRPIMDTNLSIELCASQPYVTSRYYDWWKQLKPGMKGDTIKGYDNYSLISTSSSDHLSPASSGQVEGKASYGSPPGFTSKFKRVEVDDSDKDDQMTINELLSSRCFDDEVVENGKALSSPESGVFPSSRVGDVTAGSRSKDVLRGSKRTMEDGQIENIVGEAKRAKDDGDEAKIKSPFCDRNGAPNMEGEGHSPCTVDIASNLENRILMLEKVVAKLKEAKFGAKVESIGAKVKP
ncbi:protein MAIN-LIKE 2-like [Gastrolobium bilobum]|uniref:protein MAIN-LIKE 2-like n=1 Tax=Gastrolobium bilobum TaxID=150636 RepID=UPI002AB1E2CD|nr:protein MAIN-LIKE 2-like [Gastrolobium bilobum]